MVLWELVWVGGEYGLLGWRWALYTSPPSQVCSQLAKTGLAPVIPPSVVGAVGLRPLLAAVGVYE